MRVRSRSPDLRQWTLKMPPLADVIGFVGGRIPLEIGDHGVGLLLLLEGVDLAVANLLIEGSAGHIAVEDHVVVTAAADLDLDIEADGDVAPGQRRQAQQGH